MEKQAYVLVKDLKECRMNILHSHVLAYVPNSVVKDILTQPDPKGKRGKWIAVLLEYDLNIKPTKLIKEQGLDQVMTQYNFELLGVNFIANLSQDVEEKVPPQVSHKVLESSWYNDIIFVLQKLQASPELRKTKAIFLKQKATHFCVFNGSLYWKDLGGLLLKCLLEDEAQQTMNN
jgi:hypothetical protein